MVRKMLVTSLSLILCSLPLRAWALEMPTKVQFTALDALTAKAPHFEVEFTFAIAPGWHIYYKEPGDAGFPTKLNLNLPEELEVSEIVWPEPESFVLPGDKHCKGYSNSLRLRVKVSAKSALAAGQSIPLRANLSWLNCREEMCVPQRQQLDHTFVVEG